MAASTIHGIAGCLPWSRAVVLGRTVRAGGSIAAAAVIVGREARAGVLRFAVSSTTTCRLSADAATQRSNPFTESHSLTRCVSHWMCV